jgi:3-hydroxyacyl-CoA dehydrogenase / enoyl-CoA hydratase / 3-hydroxybutyryl-CoA epimerase / enoyl-CoA isomerase
LAKGRLGQKSGLGFYRYERDTQGRVIKSVPEDTHSLLATLRPSASKASAMSAEQIVDRLMLPFIVEAAHALDEGVAASAAELDTALLLALGCPPYIGGALKYADWIGLPEVVRRCDALRVCGPMYEPTQRMRRMAEKQERFFPV